MQRTARAAAVAAVLCWAVAGGSAATGAGGGAPGEAPADRPPPEPAIRIGPDAPASVQKGIEAAARAGLKKIVLPPGTYRLPAGDRFYLRFSELKDLEIDAAGVTFLRSVPNRGGIEFSRCRNVTLRGATLLNETPPFTQGAIEAIDPGGLWYDVRIDKGYPANFDDPQFFPSQPTGYIFDPKGRQWKAGTYDLYCKQVERLGPGLFRLHWPRKEALPVAVGDLMAFRGRGGTDIYVGDCAGMSIVDVTILHGGGFCIHEDGGEGGSRYSYKVTYGPRPAGATASPLISCNADAFHSSRVRKGPTVENCLFEGMPDDGVLIHGSYCLVLKSDGPKLLVSGGPFRPGDPIRLLRADGQFAGEAVVKAVAPAGGVQPQGKSRHRPFADLTRRRFLELTLDRELKAEFDFLVADTAAIGSGYVVRNNVIRNHRARGMLLKADNGLVENNTVDGSTIAGIVLAPELWWGEACYSRDVIVRNNTIRHTGYATVGPWSNQAGAMSICGEGRGGECGHRNIVVEGNTFVDNDGINFLLTSAGGVVVRNNRFVRPMRQATTRGTGRGFDADALIWVSDCDGVRFEGNTIASPGPCMKKVVELKPSAKNVTGAETGISR